MASTEEATVTENNAKPIKTYTLEEAIEEASK